MFNNTPLALVLLFFVSGIFTQSCKREQLDNSPSAKVAFSTDTVMFDTVFTVHSGGPFPRSVNQRLKVYNRNQNTVKTNIRLMGGQASPYRINIDGQRTTQVVDYEIMGKDSIYLFVEVSLDPLNGAHPVIHDSIEFITNGNVQYVQLRAFGIDAYYFNKVTTSSDTAWNDPNKPYVIYGYFNVAEGKKLTIGPGVKVYADVGAYLFVEGTLEVGTPASKNNRVTFQGARLGADFKDIPGQWGGIWFATTSVNNSIHYADIINGIVGVRCDSLPKSGAFKVTINNTFIKNMSAVGVLGFTSKIKMVNSCVGNCGQYTFAGDLGGQYEFLHCTFANYSGTFARKEPSFALSNANYKAPDGTVYANPLSYSIRNSIIYGSLKEEVLIVTEGQGPVTPLGTAFDSNILKTEMQGLNPSNTINNDPKFKNTGLQDFKLDTLSPAHNALNSIAVSDDLEGTPRDAQPDIGAYERVE
ncbi:MAG TPA: hypothetical protein VEC12_07030 [Bacteroidia bacterium]|nr:hypothetical protein [Bacteroidia bacterium]